MGEGNPTAKPHATKDCSGVREVVGGAGSCMDCQPHHFSDSFQTSGPLYIGDIIFWARVWPASLLQWSIFWWRPFPTGLYRLLPPSLLLCSVNSNLDLIVSATDLLKALHVSPGAAMTHPHLSSLEDLQELVSYSMQHCAGTERFFTSQEVFEQTVQAATTLNHKVGQTQGT